MTKEKKGRTRSAVVSVTMYQEEKAELQQLAFKASKPGAMVAVTDLIREAIYKAIFKRPMPKEDD